MANRLLTSLVTLVATLLFSSPLTAQNDTPLRIPDEEDILHNTLSTSSPYYYTNLLLKYRNSNETLSPEEYYYLYYGYVYQEEYRPFVENKPLYDMLDVMAGINIEQPSVAQLEALIERGTEALGIDPFNPKVLNMMAFAYGALGDSERETHYFNHLNGILRAIESSGTGLKEGEPWHVLMFAHAYDLVASKGHAYNESKILSRTTMFVPLTSKTKEHKKGYYFDYSRVYRNKPEDVTFKRDRTWQFNNLKPQEYK